jgi:hypothetical protein
MKSKLLILGLSFSFCSVLFAQNYNKKNSAVLNFSSKNYQYANSTNNSSGRLIQAGLTTNIGMNFITPGQSKLIDKNGIGSCFSIGITINKVYENSPTVGFSTGLEFDFETNRYKTVDSIYYDYLGSEVVGKQNSVDATGSFSLQERNQKSIYATIPLMMLFRTSMIGNFRYFGKFGIRNSFLIKNSVNDFGVDITNIPYVANSENNNFTSPGDMFFYKGSVGLSAGAEWNFIETTSLLAEIGYFYGITPLHLDRKDANRTLYTIDNGNRTYFSNKANQNQLLFKVSILF